MKNSDIPNFAAWSLENLANFAKDAYIYMQKQDAAIQQLRLDLKDAMKLVRESRNKDDWK